MFLREREREGVFVLREHVSKRERERGFLS